MAMMGITFFKGLWIMIQFMVDLVLTFAIYQGERSEYIIIPPEFTADSSYQVIDLELDRDGVDELFDVEEIQFNGVI